jgi:hypothetical protein
LDGPDALGEPGETESIFDAVDFRLVAAGSLLPDMVDRALRRAGVRTTSPHQHLVGHTVAFNAAITAAGVSLIASRRDPRLMGVAAAAISHILVDPVIRSPKTLFWPLLGRRFPEARGLNRPVTAVTQILAAVAVGATALHLARSGRLPEFIGSGRL